MRQYVSNLQLALLGSLLASADGAIARAERPAASPNPIFYMALHTAIMRASSVITSEALAESAVRDWYLYFPPAEQSHRNPMMLAITTHGRTSCGVVLYPRSRSRWARRWRSRQPHNQAPIS